MAVYALRPLYLGIDHPSDVVSVGVGIAILVNAFRFFTPNEVFPVTYRRARPPTSTSAASGARPSAERSTTSSA